MLRLENITKKYKVADQEVLALKGLDLCFRKNEFVSILGPSGCGKTTTLNIIGGLDKYSGGNLYIRGKSTKEFSGHDWDVYRNHRIGFIFQSYNLIPHQTILGNVELALTIAGISKEERTKKAKEALDRVGLKGQYNKKPNQLSGGQCQRVAIARALVNEPEILLADEPTGALDTKTSIQIMELIKEVSKDKLVIMVTHNPELAEKYSTRIVRLLDGKLQSDSNPFSKEDEIKECEELQKKEDAEFKKIEKAKMSWFTAFKLSLKNLLSKKGRTALVAIAGSIGIIGVSSVLSVSSGIKTYIKDMQDDMLSGNPIEISESTYDLSQMMSLMTTSQKADAIKSLGKNEAGVNFVIDEILASFKNTEKIKVSNNITKDYIDYINNLPSDALAAMSFDYGINLNNNIYTPFNSTYTIEATNTSVTAIKENYIKVLSEVEGIGDYSSYITSLASQMTQAPNSKSYIESQYDVYGSVATKEDEIMIVLNKDREISDLTLALLGYYSEEEYINIAKEAKDENYDSSKNHSDYKNKFSYDELLGKEFRYYKNDEIYQKDMTCYNLINSNPLLESLGKLPFFNYSPTMDINSGMKLKVVGILEPKEDINYGCLSSGVYYTEALTKKMLSDSLQSEIVKFMVDSNIDSISSTTFRTYISLMDKDGLNITSILDSLHVFDVIKNCGVYYNVTYYSEKNNEVMNEIAYLGGESSESQMLSLMGQMMGQSSSTSTKINTISLRELGGKDIASNIKIYPTNFELKDTITAYLDDWNSTKDITVNGKVLTSDMREKITYTDNVGVMISMINSLINIVSYALIAFTALSLVVSCFMIAIITYVSVMERVKEIGVIRSLGGRKKDVTHLFNAETLIIGFTSGLFGVIVTYILSFIANIIVKNLAGINICNFLWYHALIMLLLSMILTMISGLIPANSAAKQDPVNALRSE